MKTPLIHSLRLLSLSLLLGSSAVAGELKLVAVDHGRGATYCFRKVESPATVAAVVHGRGAGSVVAAQPREKEYVWKTRNKYAPPSL